jgi:hypothetical protein
MEHFKTTISAANIDSVYYIRIKLRLLTKPSCRQYFSFVVRTLNQYPRKALVTKLLGIVRFLEVLVIHLQSYERCTSFCSIQPPDFTWLSLMRKDFVMKSLDTVLCLFSVAYIEFKLLNLLFDNC